MCCSDTAAYLLLSALTTAASDAQPLVDAVYWLESTFLVEGAACPSSLLKNLGLAHVHLVQNPLLAGKPLPAPSRDFFSTAQAMQWPAPEDET